VRRNFFRNHIIKEKTEEVMKVKERRGRRRKKLPDDLKEIKGCWKLKEDTLDFTFWRSRFGKGYGPVVRQTKE
jgi:hypothetical protein